MKITSLVDDISNSTLQAEHGVSLFLELEEGTNILFDMGQSDLFARNAQKLNKDLSNVDFAIISHGHYDHGGGLETFLSINQTAMVYVQQQAFEPHFSKKTYGFKSIGLNQQLKENPQIQLCNDIYEISSHAMLFSNVQGNCCYPKGNTLLFDSSKTSNDTFLHEQNLILREGENCILFAGCAHAGIVNIMQTAEKILGRNITHVIAGMHLSYGADDSFIELLCNELQEFQNCKFFTMHCTGQEAFEKMHTILGDTISYVTCGDTLTI